MKSLGLLICAALICVVPGFAQYSLRTGALGGPTSARAFSHPLGGTFQGSGFNRSPFNGSAVGRYSRGNYRGPLGYPYVYSLWVPDYYDYLDYQNQYAGQFGFSPDPYAPAPAPAAAGPQQPVIINQYFSAPPPQQQPNTRPQGAAPDTNNTSAQAPGDPIGPAQNYYLIAYKNHEVYSALAYWVEDKTLHYVTTQNTHNQAALDLIDVPLTKKLNQKNEVPFSIPGQ
jgi:hypothetical protein